MGMGKWLLLGYSASRNVVSDRYEAEYLQMAITKKLVKGQIISKCLFGVFNFFQKTNKNTMHILWEETD